MALSYSLKDPVKESWICKNPRCYNEITFGSYCPDCIKLATGKKLPDSIICQGCGIEVKTRNLTNMLERKVKFCTPCKKVNDRERSLEYYHTITKPKLLKDKKFKDGKLKEWNDYYHNVVRKKKLEKFLEGNVS